MTRFLLIAIVMLVTACDESSPSSVELCGDGIVDPGETCDGDCPTTCNDAVSCTSDRLVGSPDECTASCEFAPITACRDGDGCCADGCNALTDDDCSPTCGNGQVETGETCDGACVASCNDGNACTQDTLAGSASSCSSACSFQPIVACQSGDGCCPAGCNVANDSDCSAFCGDTVQSPGETCDGPSCPDTCSDGNACTLDVLAGSASTCSAACTFQPISACQSGDGCCAPGCNSLSDTDCSPTCGNGFVESGETCDGENCPTTCNDGAACTIDTLVGSAANCSAACSFQTITECQSNDGCCAAGCNAINDNDCSPSCGNDIVEPGETCEGGSCPTTCNDNVACTIDTLVGSAASCSAACSFQGITQCTDGDGCCAPGCNATNDADCSPTCGNGAVEAGETCDGASCPTSCNDSNACTLDVLTGSATSCSAACTSQPITQCGEADGCCAAGCVSSTDPDCLPGTSPIGGQCQTPADCAAQACAPEVNGFPGGYCFGFCAIDSDCPAGSHCGFGGACVDSCAAVSECRAGYACSDSDIDARTECMPNGF